MKDFKLTWEGPFSFNKERFSVLEDKLGIYLHSIKTNKCERVWYIGEGYIRSCQRRHFGNLSKEENSTVNFAKIIDLDFYDLVSNDKYSQAINENRYIQGGVNSKSWLYELPPDGFFRNFTQLCGSMRIFTARVSNEIYDSLTDSLKQCVLKSIEANLQFFLINKYSLDVYRDYEFIIGLCRNNRKYFDKSIILHNVFDKLDFASREFMEDQFSSTDEYDIDLRRINNERIEAILCKRINQRWDSISK